MHPKIDNEQFQTRGRTLPFVARFYDALMTVLTLGQERRFRTVALDLAQIGRDERVLDVGCGTGTLALLVRERVGPSGEVCGIDATPQMIDRARRKAEKQALDVRFDVGLIEDLGFPDERFDVVLSTLMMHHLPPDLKRSGLKEIWRVLKPAGRLLIIDFGGRGFSLGTLIHGSEVKRIGDGLARLVQEAGFGDVETGRAAMRGMIYVKARKIEPGSASSV